MDDLLCPACGGELSEEGLRHSLVCPHCKTKFRNRKYTDFLELLVYYDIVDDLDFMDINVYGEELMVMNEDDSEELDLTPDEFDAKNEIWNEFEDDTELNENMEVENIDQESWNIFDDDVAIDDEHAGEEEVAKSTPSHIISDDDYDEDEDNTEEDDDELDLDADIDLADEFDTDYDEEDDDDDYDYGDNYDDEDYDDDDE